MVSSTAHCHQRPANTDDNHHPTTATSACLPAPQCSRLMGVKGAFSPTQLVASTSSARAARHSLANHHAPVRLCSAARRPPGDGRAALGTEWPLRRDSVEWESLKSSWTKFHTFPRRPPPGADNARFPLMYCLTSER